MMIVDAQIHIWGADTPERPWPKPLRGKLHRAEPIGKDEVLREMVAAGIDRVVIVPNWIEGDRNDLALEAARAHPDRFAVMGRLDPQAPESRGKLAAWLAQPGMLGLRFSADLPPLMLAGCVDWVWKESEKAGIPVYVMASPSTVHLFDAVAKQYPRLKIAMDHLALPLDKKDDEAFADLDKLLALAKYPNVAVKASALPCYSADVYPYKKLHPHLRRVYDAFGPKRIFWGSDLSRLRGSLRQCVTMFTEELPWLSADDLDWIMGRGVCEWLGWKL